MHTYIHAYTHAHLHTYTHTRTHAYTHIAYTGGLRGGGRRDAHAPVGRLAPPLRELERHVHLGHGDAHDTPVWKMATELTGWLLRYTQQL